MKRYMSIFLCCLVVGPAYATRQIQDKLHYDNRVHEIGDNTGFPLEDFFRIHPDERKKKYDLLDSKGIYRSTACWRGYVASWVIAENTLYLVQIEDGNSKRTADALAPIFGDKVRKQRLEAFWFNGPIQLRDRILVFDRGKLVEILSPGREAISQIYRDLWKKHVNGKDKNSPPAE